MYKPMTIAGYVRQPYPSSLLVDVHSYCNASCKTCPYHELSKTLPMGYMENGLFKKIIDEFGLIKKEHGVRGHVTFCYMGELFIDPKIFDKISYVLDAGLVQVVQRFAEQALRQASSQRGSRSPRLAATLGILVAAGLLLVVLTTIVMAWSKGDTSTALPIATATSKGPKSIAS